jgi:hypothetical protein
VARVQSACSDDAAAKGHTVAEEDIQRRARPRTAFENPGITVFADQGGDALTPLDFTHHEKHYCEWSSSYTMNLQSCLRDV